MATAKLQSASELDDKRQRSEYAAPRNTLADSVLVAKLIHERSGGASTLEELASYLNYSGTNNGAFKARIYAARQFGLVEKSGDKFVITQLAQSILMPHYNWMPREALVQAFLNIELFKRVYEAYKGKQLPPDFGLKNALKTQFGVAPNHVERTLYVLINSADTAGFFSTRAGARTHLIIPTINKGSASLPQKQETEAEFGGGDGGDGGGDSGDGSGGNGAPARSLLAQTGSAKDRYVNTLITLFEDKAKKGELDDQLMQRIEKILEINKP